MDKGLADGTLTKDLQIVVCVKVISTSHGLKPPRENCLRYKKKLFIRASQVVCSECVLLYAVHKT